MADTLPAERMFSAVVLCFNSARYIENCVRRLVKCFADFVEPSEILVVENGSRDASRHLVEKLAAEFPDVLQPIYSEVNLGTTVSRNKALVRARGRYMLILDSDASIDSHALGILYQSLNLDPTIGIAVPQVKYPDGRFQISTDQFPTITHKLRRFLVLKAVEQHAAPPAEPVDVDYAISACWLMPRSILETVGLFDEKIFYSPEDVDFCIRVWQAGYRIVYHPTAVVVHDAQELSRGGKLSRFTLSHAKGLFYLFAKYRYCLNRERLVRQFPQRRVVQPVALNKR